jgi:hypothetical protein
LGTFFSASERAVTKTEKPIADANPRGEASSQAPAASLDRDHALNGIVGQAALHVFNSIFENETKGFFQALFCFLNGLALSIRARNLGADRPETTLG